MTSKNLLTRIIGWAAFSADTPAALLTLGAEINIAGLSGFRRIPLADFYSNVVSYVARAQDIRPDGTLGYAAHYFQALLQHTGKTLPKSALSDRLSLLKQG